LVLTIVFLIAKHKERFRGSGKLSLNAWKAQDGQGLPLYKQDGGYRHGVLEELIGDSFNS